MFKRASGSLAIAAGALLMAASSASASTTFNVNDTTDEPLLATTTGTTCVSTHGGTCTLRAAIQAADNLGGSVLINLPAGSYTLTIPAASTGLHTDDPSTGDLDIDQLNGASTPPQVTIAGAGADSTVINANSIDRGFTVHTYTGIGYPMLTVSGVTIEAGAPSDYSEQHTLGGGAIYNEGGTLTIENSMLTDNSASSGEGGAVYEGGLGISLTDSTIAGNSAPTAGGGIVITGGVARLTNDTIDGNSSSSGGGLAYLTQAAATSQITNVTIAHNSGTYGGGIYGPVYALAIENTVIAANSNTGGAGGAGDCYGESVDSNGPDEASTADLGGNLDSDGTCFANGVNGDVTGADAKLGTLSDANGGPTPTDALDADSPAIFLARAAACPSGDQRGQARLSNFCDAGAYQGDDADLSVSGSGAPLTATGQVFTDTFTVTNSGPYGASGVTFTDQLPSGVTGSASASQGTCTGGGTLSCALGSLAAAQGATITVQLTAAKAGTLVDTGTVAAGSLDPHPANDSASVSTVTGAPPSPSQIPAIHGDTPPVKGDTLTATPGTWIGSGLTFSYGWVRCAPNDSDGSECSLIDGATGSTYLVSAADVGHSIAVAVTASNAFGFDSEFSYITEAALAGLLQVSSTSTDGGSVTLPLECSDPSDLGLNPECVLLIILSGGQLNPAARALASVHVLGASTVARTQERGKHHPKAITYASKKVKLPAGRHLKVKITLNRAGQALLHKLHTLRLTLTISESGKTLTSRKVTFKYKKPGKKKSG
jgi:uncharacterized repeat protein (TIGR01451 family)